MDQPGQKGAGRQHNALRLEAQPDLRDDAGHAVALEGQVVDCLLEQRQVGLRLQAPPYRLLVEQPIGLRASGAHRRPLAGVEQPKLYARLVGGERHRAAQRVDLPDQVPLADATDRRIAGHLPQRLDTVGKQQRPASHAGRRQRSLGPGVPAANDDDLETRGKQHALTRTTAVQQRCADHTANRDAAEARPRGRRRRST